MISLAPLLIIKTTNRNCLCLTAQGDDQIKDAKSNSVMFFFFFWSCTSFLPRGGDQYVFVVMFGNRCFY